MRTIRFTRLWAIALLLGCMSRVQPSESTGAFSIYEYTQEYIDASWNENEAAIITLYGSTADIRGSGAAFTGGTLTIREAGTYLLSGMLENGQVLIDAGKDDVVRLVLNGVSLHNETGPAIYAPKAKEIVLIIETGTQNAVSDGSGRTASDENAAIYVQNSLSITGSGLLAVTGTRHGIRSQDTLTITGGVISVNSAGDAIRGRDGAVITGGRFTLEAGGDGIQSNNEDETKGFVTITGGTFNIKAYNDGIQAESVLTITGGTFEIVTGGGAANAPARAESFTRGWGRQTPIPQTAEDSVSMKGIKAGKLINIAGGDITIDARDDGVHSNDNVVITSGRLSIRTGDDGIHGDGAVIISGGEINIPVCYEGIEGLSVTISGGNIAVISRDDAVNAADGLSGGRMGWGRSLNNNIFVRISGGTVDLFALHDGIDSNGNVFIEGGTIKISGPSQMMEGAIDFDGNLLVTGGELITAGSVLGASQNSTQPVLFVSYTRQQASGSVIAIKDSRGNTLLEYTSKTAYSYSGFTSPSFKTGETYSLFINGSKRVDIRLAGMITSIGDDGRAYSGGRGGMRRW
ncbi:MAG: carbohydrate-binding domain-containing protein [Treponema sp.]|jgi:hypothetical protein|nr:carbohydrate-binding domain-containing protein [Treponema sp.]